MDNCCLLAKPSPTYGGQEGRPQDDAPDEVPIPMLPTPVGTFASGSFVKFIARNSLLFEFRVGATEPPVVNDNNQNDCGKDANPEHEENPEHGLFLRCH